MKLKRQFPFLLLAASLAHPATARAEGTPFSLTPGGGAVFYQANGGEGTAAVAGLKGDYLLDSRELPGEWAVECAFSAATLKTAVADTDKSFAFRVGPLWALPPLRGVTALLGAGFGMLYGNSNPATKTAINPYISFGIGASFPLWQRLALRFDADRFQTLDVSVAKGYEVSAGISYAFGSGGGRGSSAPGSALTGGDGP